MKRIAIVDDNRNLRHFFEEKFNESGVAEVVLTATNGQDFLQQLAFLKPLPDLAVMDIEMPEMDGIETLRQTKALYPEIEVIMLTVFDESERVFDAIKSGAIGYLLKDEPVEKIIETIVTITEENGAVMSPRIARKIFEFLAIGPGKAAPEELPAEETVLSQREKEILEMLVEGFQYQEIAGKLNISPQTVRTHLKNIYKKLHVRNKVEAVRIAIKKRWFV
jgi:DNA-binding NarL/FixJ family response regulator